MNEKPSIKPTYVKPINKTCCIPGALPTSYLESLTYQEQLMYLCKKMDEIINLVNGNISQEIKNYIELKFNDMMINTMYDEETETLILYLESEDN